MDKNAMVGAKNLSPIEKSSAPIIFKKIHNPRIPNPKISNLIVCNLFVFLSVF